MEYAMQKIVIEYFTGINYDDNTWKSVIKDLLRINTIQSFIIQK